MAGSLNQVTLIGHLGRDPECRTTSGGTKVANLSVATSEDWKDKSTGEKKSKTEWHRVVIWGELAGIADKYLRKGSKVYLSGKLQTRKWTDNAGVEKYSTEVVLQGFDAKLIMLDGRNGNSGGASAGQSGGWDSDGDMDAPSGGRSAASGIGGGSADFNDDIPF